MTKLITVFGATGNQGGSVAKSFLADPEWKVRAVTRDSSKPAAQALAAQGAEVVVADLNDKASVEAALAGSFAAFGVTNYWEVLSGEKELQLGKNIADAAKAAGVQFYVFSSLPPVARITNGALKNVYHFDYKAKVQDYITSIGLTAAFYQPAFFYSNYRLGHSSFLRQVDGKWIVASPAPQSTVVASLDVVADTGTIVKAMVEQRDKVSGQVVAGISRLLDYHQLIDGLKEAFPASADRIEYLELSDAEFKAGMKASGAPDFIVEEMHENMLLIRDFHYYGPDEAALFKKTVDLVGGEDKLTDWVTYLKNEPAFAALRG